MKGQKVAWLVVTSVCLLMSLVASTVAADEGADAGAGGDAANANSPTKAPPIDAEVRDAPGRISCYKCSSNDDKTCTKTSPSGAAIHQDNCQNANTFAKDWLTSNKLDKLGLKSADVGKLFDIGQGALDKVGGKDVTGCAFFYSSTRNVVTANIDAGIDKLKDLLGKTDATSTTVVEYVKRDCVTAPASKADVCVPVLSQLEQAVTIYLCICNTDKCNEGVDNPHLKGLIDSREDVKVGNSAWGHQHDKSLIWITTVIMLSTYLIL